MFQQTTAVYNDNVDRIIEALRAEDFQVRFDREGASNKRHTLLGVVLCYEGNETQYVCPCYNDLEFELNPIRLREGKLCVMQKSIGTASSKGLKWFETKGLSYRGSMAMFIAPESALDDIVYTQPPMYEPVEPLVPKDEAAANAADAVQATPAAAA